MFSSSLVQLEPYDGNRSRQKTQYFIVSQFWVSVVATTLLTGLTFLTTMTAVKLGRGPGSRGYAIVRARLPQNFQRGSPTPENWHMSWASA